ncbi:MAG: CoA synthetase [Chloroflexi bacterium]|nr:CoA synthetase [Chloroflexota bacterium]
MAVVLARDLRDGEIGMIGASSEIPMAACLLAQRFHAPNLTLITPAQIINPKPWALYRSSSDGRYARWCDYLASGYELFENSERGLDFMFYSGIQIDQYGNVNLTFVGGDHGHPRFRGPGLANISFAITAKRTYLYPTTHNRRVFVERVDYITAPGHLDGPEGRRRAGISTEGPALCVSPLAVMDFEQSSKRMRLRSLHPDVTLDEVVSNTGFSLVIPPSVQTTAPPTKEEVHVLREIDRYGVLHNGERQG